MEIIFILLLILGSAELATYLTYGWFVSKNITDVFMDLNESKLRLNQFNHKILGTNPFIDKVPFGILTKYYIYSQGTVPRWSPLHKRIEEYYAIAIKNANK